MSGMNRKIRAVPLLVAINIGIYIYQVLIGPQERQVFATYALSLNGLADGRWWQFITHAFLHGNLLHLVLNMVALWVPGRIVERVMGSGRFVALYLFGAVAGGVVQMLFVGGNSMLLGASGAVCAVILAFTTIFPEAQRVFLIFFVLPLRLKAKYLGWGITFSSFLLLVLNVEPWIGHAAHLGGCLGGYFFARLSGYGTPTFVERWFMRRAEA